MHRIMIVCESSYAARDLRSALGLNRSGSKADVWPVFPGESVMGRRVSEAVVVPRDLYARLLNPGESQEEKSNNQWWRERMLCRMMPGCQLVTI